MDLPTLLGALQFLALAGLITVCVFLFRYDIPVRAIRALSRRIRGERGPSPAHPAAKAVQLSPALPVDGRPLDEYEQRALDSLELRARVPQQRKTP